MHARTYTGMLDGRIAVLSEQEPTNQQLQETLDFYHKLLNRHQGGGKSLPFIMTDTGETILTLIAKHDSIPKITMKFLFEGYSSKDIAWLINYKSDVPGSKTLFETDFFCIRNTNVIKFFIEKLGEAGADIENFGEIYNNISDGWGRNKEEVKELLAKYHNDYAFYHPIHGEPVAAPIAVLEAVEAQVATITPSTTITIAPLPEATETHAIVIGDADVVLL